MLLIKQKVKSDLKAIFIQHGALDHDITLLAPVQDSATIFVSEHQQVHLGEIMKGASTSDLEAGDVRYVEIDCRGK